jgi:hypothetical protein
MFDTLKTAVSRNPATLAQDFAGAAAILVIFLVGLSLPGLG